MADSSNPETPDGEAAVAGWLAGSRVLRGVDELSTRFAAAADASVAGRLADAAGRWIRGSVCYRWLLADSESAVIVIDLRETATVGPVIRLLDRVTEPLAAAWEGSRATAAGEVFADSRSGRVVRAVLDPPDPPTERDGSERGSDSQNVDGDDD